jgi:hypothetical protein
MKWHASSLNRHALLFGMDTRWLHINQRWLPKTTLFITEKTMTSKDNKRLREEEEADESTALTKKQRMNNDDSSSKSELEEEVSSKEEMNLQ